MTVSSHATSHFTVPLKPFKSFQHFVLLIYADFLCGNFGVAIFFAHVYKKEFQCFIVFSVQLSLDDFTVFGGAFGNKQDNAFKNIEVGPYRKSTT